MKIQTDSEAVIEARKNTLHLLMAEHKTNCFKCIKNGACELQALAREYGIDVPNFKASHGDVQHEPCAENPFLSYDARTLYPVSALYQHLCKSNRKTCAFT